MVNTKESALVIPPLTAMNANQAIIWALKRLDNLVRVAKGTQQRRATDHLGAIREVSDAENVSAAEG